MAKMPDCRIILAVLWLIALSGCTYTANISIVDPLYDRQNPSMLEKTLTSSNPEDSYNLILKNYRTDSRTGFQNAMGHTNYFNDNWNNHRNYIYANYYAAWSSLYLIDEPDIETIGGFDRYDRYITRFYLAQWYAKKVLARAGSGNEFAFKAAQEIISLTNEGRTNSRVFYEFLQARHTMDIKVYNAQDTRLYNTALQEFRDLRRRHPRWLPQVVQAQIRELEEQLQ